MQLPTPSRGTVLRRVLTAAFKDYRQFMPSSRARKLARECPVCGFKGYFLSLERGMRPDARCPGCASRERHRLQHLYLMEGGWKLAGKRVLHFAPERYMLRLMRNNPLYISGDIRQPDAGAFMDATAIPEPDSSYDVLIAHHLLEHIPADHKALSEFHRVLKPGGWMLLTVPQNLAAETTDEDPTVTDPLEKFWRYTGYDHCRMYGRDFAAKVAAAGFEVTPYIRPGGDNVRYALLRDEVLYVCKRID